MMLADKNQDDGTPQWTRKFEKVQAKKLVKSLGQIPFFAISKMAKNQFLNWEKVLNCQKCNFTKTKIDLFGFASFFFCLNFFKYSGPL